MSLPNARGRTLVLSSAILWLTVAAPASASQLVDRNATQVRLAVHAKGEALVTYRARGALRRVLARNAVDARPPTAGRSPRCRCGWPAPVAGGSDRSRSCAHLTARARRQTGAHTHSPDH